MNARTGSRTDTRTGGDGEPPRGARVPSDRALLVIDMQNLFCHPEGTLARIAGPLHAIEETVAGVTDAVERARNLGHHLIWTRHCYDAEYVNAGPNFPGRNPMGISGRELMEYGAFVEGTWDSGILGRLVPGEGESVIDKTRYDAFLGTSLEPLLRRLGVEHLDFCGVVTNICVESTVRAAYMRDFACTVFTDATTAGTPQLHENALRSIDAGCFATLATVRAPGPRGRGAPEPVSTAGPAGVPGSR